ncbi:MAG: transglycosylase domain-containing protein [Bacillota bacterium]
MPADDPVQTCEKKATPVNWKNIWILAAKILILSGLLLGGMFFFFLNCMDTNINLDDLVDLRESSIIYDVHNDEVARLFQENRINVDLQNIPETMRNAVLAIEDSRFYQHGAFDPRGILRAIKENIFRAGIEQGASTITQQLARNAFLSQERTWLRKIREAFIAIRIEKKYAKDQIFESYLNCIYFGHGAYGVEAAAQTYFGKHIQELTLSEMALLAGIPQRPSTFSPYTNMKAAIARRNTVLNRMLELGYITEAERNDAKTHSIKLKGLSPYKHAPYFVSYVIQQLTKKYSEAELFTGGYRIYTTLDLKIQEAAENALKNGLPPGDPDTKGVPQPQASLVCLDPKTGQIKAMVGGTDFQKTQLNRCLTPRQPGSAIKPFTYAAAIDSKRFTTATIFNEYRVVFEDKWSPKNVDDIYLGPITLRKALEKSSNTVTAQLTHEVGLSTVAHYARRMGLKNIYEGDYNLAALSLGGLIHGVTSLELASAYTPFANRGIHTEPISILRITDKDGRLIEKFPNPQKTVALPENTAYIVTDMMRGVIENKEWGTARGINLGRPAAGKTGTTTALTNAWFVGFTPDLLAAVWIGNDQQNQPTKYGSWQSARIWAMFMSAALARIPPSDFIAPGDLDMGISIDIRNGGLADDQTPAAMIRNEMFLPGTAPLFSSNETTAVEICSETGLLATSACPRDKVITGFFLISTNQNVYDGSAMPERSCDQHGPGYIEVEICTRSNKRPTSFCPRESITKRKFIPGTEPGVNDLCDIHGFS